MLNQLMFVEDGRLVTDSLTVATVLGRRHDNVVRDIRLILQRGSFQSGFFEEATYVNFQNRELYPKYIITHEGLKVLVSSYRGVLARRMARELGMDIVSQDLEGKYLEIVSDAFAQYEQQFQFKVGPYRIDLYFPELRLAVEFDEEHHTIQRESDRRRQAFIEEKLGCRFIRFTPEHAARIGQVINKIMILTYSDRMHRYTSTHH